MGKFLSLTLTILFFASINLFDLRAEEGKAGMTNSNDNRDGKNLKKILTPLQYEVTQKEGTETPFNNEYWDNHEEGIYVDVVSGEPLFSSKDKFDSGTGWPSFTKPLVAENLISKKDIKLFSERTEIRSKSGNSHLGHVFDDGPKAAGGKRYCMNSAAMRFIPVSKLKEEGYGEFVKLFDKKKAKTEIAIFAAGCFWGVEDIIRKTEGVVATRVGYIGGKTDHPTYEAVKTGTTGHAEAVEVEFDPEKISYQKLLDLFFRLHDPTTLNRQGNDIGTQYRSTIFYRDDAQMKLAKETIERLEKIKKYPRKISTTLEPAKIFYGAEEYHQKYLQKNPGGYTCHFLRD